MSFNKKLEKVRKVVRLHMNWLISTVLGDDVLSKEERDELKSFKLSKDSISLTEKAFILGRVKAVLKKSDWKNFTWEDLQDKTASLSPLEKLAVNAAKQKAATHIRGLTNDIATGVFTALQQAQASTVTEASLKQIIADEVALGILEKKNYKQVASSIAEKTKTANGDRWELISRTELHAAKIQGTAQAIINKVDVYQHSDGPDSKVSIIPNPGTCPDCANHFLDNNGTPLVFTLKELLDAGSNADPGTNHSKKNNIHTHWKTTLPPLHPSCRCQLVYIPPGYSWVGTKLTLTDSEALMKAIGDSKLSATIKPPGPPTKSGPATPATIPGVKSPAQGSKSPTTSTKVDTPSAGPQMSPCPFGGGDSCRKHGGNGAKTHEAGGSIMKAHQEALAAGATPDDPQAAEQLRQETVTNAIEWGKQEHPHATALAHLSKGKIVNKQVIGEPGVTNLQEVFKVTIEGNGNACLKPTHELSAATKDRLDNNLGITEGYATVPHGKGPENEETGYTLAMGLGLTSHVPPTVTRTVDGKKSSMSSWKETYQPVSTLGMASGVTHGNPAKFILDSAPPDKKDAVLTKLKEGVVLALATNNQDMHFGNVLYDPESADVQFIDHTSIGGIGMAGVKCSPLQQLANAGYKVDVPSHVMDRLSKTSLGDVKRSSPHMEDWQQGQTFLRMKYIEHLQNTEGHLDPERFRMLIHTADGTPLTRDKGRFSADEATSLAEEGKLPNQLFEQFATEWITQHAHDEKSPHHEDAKAIRDIGVFMPATAEVMSSPAAFRAAGKHREHEKSVYASADLFRSRKEHSAAKKKKDDESMSYKKELESAPTQKDLSRIADEATRPAAAPADPDATRKSLRLYVRLT